MATLSACRSLTDFTVESLLSFRKQKLSSTETYWASSELLSFLVRTFLTVGETRGRETPIQIMGILYELSNSEVLSNQMIALGLHEVCISFLRASIDDKTLLDDKEGLYSLNIINNLAMWDSCRAPLITAGAVQAIDKLSATVTNGSLEKEVQFHLSVATSLAYLVGKKDDKDNQLLVRHPGVLQAIMDALTATLRGEAYHGCVYSVHELLLAIHNLALSDANKVMLGSLANMEVLVRILKNSSFAVKDLELASACLLELSFNTEARKLMRTPTLQRQIEKVCRALTTGPARHNLQQLIWVLKQVCCEALVVVSFECCNSKAFLVFDPPYYSVLTCQSLKPQKDAGGVGEHVMISYPWTHQVCVVPF